MDTLPHPVDLDEDSSSADSLDDEDSLSEDSLDEFGDGPDEDDEDAFNNNFLEDEEYRNTLFETRRDIMIAADESINEDDAQFIDPDRLFDSLSVEEIQHLFTIDPKWYTPLLTTAKGLLVLGMSIDFGYGRVIVVDDYDDSVDLDQLMHACLHIQSNIQGGDFSMVSSFLSILSAFPRSLYKAIRHYLHPDQTNTLAQLTASFLIPPPPTTPPQYNVPPEALPLLFPTIDTTQFSPQFDWFIYLLSQFSPVDEAGYTSNLSTLVDTISHPTEFLSLKPGFTLDKVFIHNHLMNSYDEFLHHKLPQVLPLIPSADSQTVSSPSATSPNLLFPYFPDQHPLLPSITSKDEFSALLSNPTCPFTTYFNYMFVLGPMIQSAMRVPNFEMYPASASSLSLATKLRLHQYRPWLLNTTSTTASPVSISPANNSSLHNASINNTATPNLQPPDFTTSPLTLLRLTLLADRSTNVFYDAPSLQLSHPPTWTNEQQPFIVTQTYYRFLFHILSHSFPDETTRDAHLDKALCRLLSANQSPGTALTFSYTLYQHGYITLHQHAYRLLLNQPNYDHRELCSFLLSPLTRTKWYKANWNEVTKHIALCVHAGFLTPIPTPPPHLPDPTVSSTQDAIVRSIRSDFHHFHALTSIRCILYAVLVRMTGLISYFPQSTQFLANAVHIVVVDPSYSTPSLSLTPWSHYGYQIPFLPPHSFTITDPRDTMHRLAAALVDDEGELYAIKYGDGEAKEEVKGWHVSKFLFPLQGAPRHKHLLQGTALSDVRVCLDWSRPQVLDYPELAVGADCNPYFRPRVSDDDLAWIESEDNQKNLNLSQTRELQKKLTAYYRQVNQVETAMVVAQMHKVLTKAYETGLFDASNAGQKRKHHPPSSLHNASTRNASTESAVLKAASSSPFRSPHHTYPLPNLPRTPNMIQKLDDDALWADFSKPRGVLARRSTRHLHKFFYDHNYFTTFVTGDSISDLPPDTPKNLFNKRGHLKTDWTVSMETFFRQRSEWALELLMVGCFGLDAVSTQKSRPPWLTTNAQPSSNAHSARTNPSIPAPTPPPHLQQCKDHILQHLPILLNTIPPTPTTPWDPTKPYDPARLSYYYDTLTHITFLTTLPLYDTLISLSSPSL